MTGLNKASIEASKIIAAIFAAFMLALFASIIKPGWYILPATGSIVLSCLAIAKLPRTKFELFDPRLIVWLVICYTQGISFFLNSLLNYYWSVTPIYYSDSDMLSYELVSASISLAGVTLFFLIDSLIFRWERVPRCQKDGKVLRKNYATSIILLAIVAIFVQVYIFAKFGGINGYLNALTDDRDLFEGFGILYTLAEPFPILLIFLWATRHLKRGTKPTWNEILIVLAAFVFMKLLFGGLRGSRSNTVWGIFWFLGIINILFVKIRLRVAIISAILILAFVVIYSGYKTYGARLIYGDVGISSAIDTSGRYDGRPVAGVLLEDFSRSGTQTLVVAQASLNDEYLYRHGKTYIGSLLLIVPSWLLPFEKPDTKLQAGTDLLYGRHYAALSDKYSSRIYGLFGEGILNFGLLFSPFAIVIFAYLYRITCSWIYSLETHDPRILIYPLLINALFIALVSDSDNLIFFLIKNGAIPILCIAMICARPKRFC